MLNPWACASTTSEAPACGPTPPPGAPPASACAAASAAARATEATATGTPSPGDPEGTSRKAGPRAAGTWYALLGWGVSSAFGAASLPLGVVVADCPALAPWLAGFDEALALGWPRGREGPSGYGPAAAAAAVAAIADTPAMAALLKVALCLRSAPCPIRLSSATNDMGGADADLESRADTGDRGKGDLCSSALGCLATTPLTLNSLSMAPGACCCAGLASTENTEWCGACSPPPGGRFCCCDGCGRAVVLGGLGEGLKRLEPPLTRRPPPSTDAVREGGLWTNRCNKRHTCG